MSEDFSVRPRVGRDEVVVRYAGGSHFDPSTGKVNGSAFDRDPKDTDGLSVDRRGVFDVDEAKDRAAIRNCLATRRTLGRTGVFLEVAVGAALETLAEFEEDIFLCHDPLPANGSEAADPAHALIIGLPFKGEAIGSLKAELAGDRLCGAIVGRF